MPNSFATSSTEKFLSDTEEVKSVEVKAEGSDVVTQADKAMKIFDESNFSPSAMDEIEEDVKFADEKMMDAILTFLELK